MSDQLAGEADTDADVAGLGTTLRPTAVGGPKQNGCWGCAASQPCICATPWANQPPEAGWEAS